MPEIQFMKVSHKFNFAYTSKPTTLKPYYLAEKTSKEIKKSLFESSSKAMSDFLLKETECIF